MATKKKDEERFPVEVTEAERRQVHLALKMRVDAVKKEGTKLEGLGLSKETVQSSLAVLEGDGTDGGILRRFGTRDQEDMFATPKPEGAVNMGEVEYKSAKALADSYVEKITTEGELYVEDAGGQRFFMNILPVVTFVKRADRCRASADGGQCVLDATPEKDGLCPEHQAEREKVLAEEKEAAKKEAGPQLVEGDATSVLDQKRFLARKKIENDLISGAGDRDFEPLMFHLDMTDMDFLDQFLAINPEKVDLDHLPVLGGWNANDLKGVKFVGKGRVTAEEMCLCAVHFWHAKASGKGGKYTKGDVEDIQNRLISWKAREDQKED